VTLNENTLYTKCHGQTPKARITHKHGVTSVFKVLNISSALNWVW